MANYIAEKMAATDYASDNTRASAQRECFETILMLWDHQSRFHRHARPFGKFEPIFSALSHLNPNKPTPSYFSWENHESSPNSEVQQTVKLMVVLDSAVRVMISFLARNSILQVTDESTIEWLKAVNGLVDSDEVRVIVKLLPDIDDKEETTDLHEVRKKELSEYIKKLEAFEAMSKEVKSALNTELQTL